MVFLSVLRIFKECISFPVESDKACERSDKSQKFKRQHLEGSMHPRERFSKSRIGLENHGALHKGRCISGQVASLKSLCVSQKTCKC